MNVKNTKYLLKKYPKLYAQYYWDKRDTCMCWGFPGDGWFKLIDTLSKRITKLDREGEIQATQVKEKFGGLRFYFRASGENHKKLLKKHEAIGKLVQIAEEKSFSLCEECGKKGVIRKDLPWVLTLCKVHYANKINFRYPKNKK